MPRRERSAPVVIDLGTTASSSLANSCFWYEVRLQGEEKLLEGPKIKQSVECKKRSDPDSSWVRNKVAPQVKTCPLSSAVSAQRRRASRALLYQRAVTGGETRRGEAGQRRGGGRWLLLRKEGKGLRGKTTC